MLSLPALLAPVSPQSPCGVDPSSTTTLSELENLVRREVGMVGSEVAEEPDWKTVETQATAAAKTCKDLRVAGMLTAASVRSQGLEGLLNGLQLVRGYLETYWESVYPLLDPADANDPTERVNAVANLAAPMSSDGDALRILEALRKVPLVIAPRAGRITLEHFLAAKGSLPWAGGGAAPTLALLEAGIKEVGPATIGQTRGVIESCLAEAKAIISIFKTQSGPSSYPELDPLTRELGTILTCLGGRVSTPAPGETASESTGANATEIARSAGTPSSSGTISNREDVIRALDGLVRYYEQNEPSSPVPFLLKRIRHLVPMNFVQLITELTPDSMSKILSLTGQIE